MLLTVVMIVLSSANGCISTSIESRIVGGYKTSIEHHPWQVYIGLNGPSCGGSIVTRRHIVTAAHCIKDRDISDITVHYGITAFEGTIVGGHSISGYHVHPGFDRYARTFDIAVLRLNTELVYSAKIGKIKMADVEPADDAAAKASGYGATRWQGENANELRAVDVHIISNARCAELPYEHGQKIGDTMICANDPYKDTCQGDSGGPLISGGLLVGVVSWGNRCALLAYPGVYANVAELKTWVWSAINRFP